MTSRISFCDHLHLFIAHLKPLPAEHPDLTVWLADSKLTVYVSLHAAAHPLRTRFALASWY